MQNADKKPNYEKFLISTSQEIMAVKDRVRYLINDKNWGEEGRYKEIIFREILRSFLPERYGICTGFAICKGDNITSQIDIIIYDKFKANNNAEILKKGDFVVVESKSVVGIIEVKSSFDSNIFSKKNDGDRNAIEKILDNKKLINLSKPVGKSIFAGIFAFDKKNGESDYSIKTISDKLKMIFENTNTKLDCIAFDKNHFMKFWGAGLPYKDDEGCRLPHYSFYKFGIDLETHKDLDFGFGYFISNLLEYLKVERTGKKLSEDEIRRFYPIKGGGKEIYRIEDCEIVLENGR